MVEGTRVHVRAESRNSPDPVMFAAPASLVIDYAWCDAAKDSTYRYKIFRKRPDTEVWDSIPFDKRSLEPPYDRTSAGELEHLSDYSIGMPRRPSRQ